MHSSTSNKFIFIIFTSNIFANNQVGNLSDTPLGVQFGFLLFFGIWFIWMFKANFKVLKRKKAIQGVPTSKIRAVAMGQVEVSGDIISTLTEPVDKKECVYYYLSISQGEGKYWRLIHYETKSESFFLNDGTGSVLIPGSLIPNLFGKSGGKMEANKASGLANLDEEKKEFYFESPNEFPESLIKYCEKNAVQFSDKKKIDEKIKVFISYVKANKKLYILGDARPLNESEKNFMGEASIVIDKKDEEIFSLTDKGEKYLLNSMGGLWWKFPGSLLIPGFFFWMYFIYRG